RDRDTPAGAGGRSEVVWLAVVAAFRFVAAPGWFRPFPTALGVVATATSGSAAWSGRPPPAPQPSGCRGRPGPAGGAPNPPRSGARRGGGGCSAAPPPPVR